VIKYHLPKEEKMSKEELIYNLYLLENLCEEEQIA